ncbi:MAG: hypothetical protein E7523_07900 [Ruminococcaceae bacterium]|nr:hypothetical protein [Oscillospiraceae bacterium]
MKKKSVLCLILVLLLCFPGCVTLRLQAENTQASLENTFPPTEATADMPTEPPLPSEQSVSMVPETSPTQGFVPEHITEVPLVTQPAAPQQTDADWSVTQAVSFLNNAVNAVKTSTYPFVMTEDIQHSVYMQSVSTESLRDPAKAIIEQCNRSTVTEYTVLAGTTGANGEQVNINSLIPPYGETFVLTEAEVSAARVSLEGDHTLIVMTLYDDTASADNAAPAVHGTKIPFIDPFGKSADAYTVQSADIRYSKITLAARVDGQGRLLALTASSDVLGFVTVGIGVMNAQSQCSGKIKETRTFSYS